MDDFLIVDVSAALAASKRTSYRQSVRAMYQSLAIFLEKNQLTTHALVDEEAHIPDEFGIRRSDLTDVGFEVMRRKLDYWLDSVSSANTASEDVSILESELQAVLDEQTN